MNIDFFVNKIYQTTNEVVIPKKRIQKIEALYKKNYNKCDTIEEIFCKDKTLLENVEQVQSIKAEISKQLLWMGLPATAQEVPS